MSPADNSRTRSLAFRNSEERWKCFQAVWNKIKQAEREGHYWITLWLHETPEEWLVDLQVEFRMRGYIVKQRTAAGTLMISWDTVEAVN